MNIGNLTGKISQKADLIGKLAGFLMPMNHMAKASGRNIIMETIDQITWAAKTMDIERVMDKIGYHLTEGVGSQPVKLGVYAIVGAEIASALGIGKAGALRKFGWEAIKYSALSTAIILAGCPQDEAALASFGGGSSGHSGGNSTTWRTKT